ncbi:hypothetical protein AUJ62_01585 [Candidatus Pacearchaeota archaeon CG1_02_32_21]|nr:MAG: hypothetical protein AUJ62_01585 [Candidatus Pacearchaeota archaeon CG1_02_32_21]
MMIVYFTEKDTSKEKIEKFLKLAEDDQEFHRDPWDIMPGMFYLKLVSQHIAEGIAGLNIELKGMRKYPFGGKIDITKYNGTAEAVIYDDQKEILSTIKLTLDNRPDLTEARLSKVYSLAGELLDYERDKLNRGKISAIYNSQSAHFNGYEFDSESLIVPIFGLPFKEKKSLSYPIRWVSDKADNRKLIEVGTGTANFRFTSTQTLERKISSI